MATLRWLYLFIAMYHLLTHLVFRRLKSLCFELNDFCVNLTKYSIPLIIEVAVLLAALVENSVIYLWNFVVQNTQHAYEAQGSVNGLLISRILSNVTICMMVFCLGFHGLMTAVTLWEQRSRMEYEEKRELQERVHKREMEAREKYHEERRQDQIYRKKLLIHEKRQAMKQHLMYIADVQRASMLNNPLPIKTIPMSEYFIDLLCNRLYEEEYNGK